MTAPRTYWHLENLRRKPTDYEVATTGLLYYPAAGFEVKVPLAEWYRKYQSGSPLALVTPDQFRDPRETTYTTYTELQRDREVYVDGLLRSMEEPAYDGGISPEWTDLLSRFLVPLRYPAHGLQMAAAYVGQMAPAGRIVLTAMFQAADEIRRIQRLAYRQAQLRVNRPGFGEEGRRAWEKEPMWQPLRRLIEELLVAYDWGECFAALNLVVKPFFDQCFLVYFGEAAARSGDPLLGRMLQSLNEDSLWHREWSAALVRRAVEEKEENRVVLGGWISRWAPRAREAVEPFVKLFAGRRPLDAKAGMDGEPRKLRDFVHQYWTSLSLSIPEER